MNFKKPLVASVVVLGALAGNTAVFAAHTDAIRLQLRHVDQWSSDLVPAFAEQMRDPGARTGASYHYGAGSDQLGAIMALGRFRGQEQAFEELWNHYPDAALYGPLRDLDNSFRATDLSLRRSRNNDDVTTRWTRIRQAYFQFRHNLDLDGGTYNDGQPWFVTTDTPATGGRTNDNGYTDDNGVYHRNRHNNAGSDTTAPDNTGVDPGMDNGADTTDNNGFYDDNGVFHPNTTHDNGDAHDAAPADPNAPDQPDQPDVPPHADPNP